MMEKLSTDGTEINPNALMGNPIVIFDGLSHFCTFLVQFTLKRDKRGVFHFAPLQSELGSALMTQYGLEATNAQSILLVKGGLAFVKSDAVLEIAAELGPPWRACGH